MIRTKAQRYLSTLLLLLLVVSGCSLEGEDEPSESTNPTPPPTHLIDVATVTSEPTPEPTTTQSANVVINPTQVWSTPITTTQSTAIPVPNSEFTITVPGGWRVEPLIPPRMPKPYGLSLQSATRGFDYILYAYRFQEGQSGQELADRWFERAKINTYETERIAGTVRKIGHSSSAADNTVNQLAIVTGERQMLVVRSEVPQISLAESTKALKQLLNSIVLGEEHARKAKLAERSRLEDSNFSFRRLKNYFWAQDPDRPWQVMMMSNYGAAPELEIEVFDFSGSEEAQAWADMRTSQSFGDVAPVQVNGINGFVANPFPDRRNIAGHIARLTVENQGIQIRLTGLKAIPGENENVFETVLHSVQWEE